MAETAYLEQVGKSLEGLTLKIGLAEVGVKALRTAFHEVSRQIATRFLGLENHVTALLRERLSIYSEINRLNVAAVPGHEEEVRKLQRILKITDLKLVYEKELQKYGLLNLGALGFELGLLAKASIHYAQINQNLIEANSSLGYRNKLVADTLDNVLATGAGFEQASKAAAALVHYSMDEETTWRQNLKLVTQLELGIGLSAQQSARLATITERQVGGSFKGVADTLATIVDRTALAADEAAKMAEAIESAVGAMREGLGGQIDSVIKVVGDYESAFKRLGGQSGEVTKLIDSLTTIQGLPAAGLLGIQNPEFLASAKGTEEVLRRIGATVNQFTAGMGGFQRQARLEGLSQVMGISARQLNLMGRMQEQVNQQRGAELTLQERFQKQMQATGQGFARLKNELAGLLEGALLPAVRALNWLTAKLADFVALLNRHQGEVEAIRAVIFAVGGLLTIKAIPSILKLLGYVVDLGVGALGAGTRLGALTMILSRIIPVVPGAARVAGLAGITSATGITVIGMLPMLGAIVAIGFILSKFFDAWHKSDEAERQARESAAAAAAMRGNLKDTEQRVLARGFFTRDLADIKNAIFGHGGHGGLAKAVADEMSYQRAYEFANKENRPELKHYLEVAQKEKTWSQLLDYLRENEPETVQAMEQFSVGITEAIDQITNQQVRPLVEALRYTEATKSLSMDTRMPAGVFALQKFYSDFNALMKQQLDQIKENAAKDRDQKDKAEISRTLNQKSLFGPLGAPTLLTP